MKKLFLLLIIFCFMFCNCSKIRALLDRGEHNWDREFVKIQEQIKPAVVVYEDAVKCGKEKINYYTDGKNGEGNYILNSNFKNLSDTTKKDFIEIFKLSLRADAVAKPIYQSWIILETKQNKTKKDIETARVYLQKLTEAKGWLKMIVSLAKGYIQRKF